MITPNTTLDELKTLPINEGYVSHAELLLNLQVAMKSRGWRPGYPLFGRSKDGKHMTAAMRVMAQGSYQVEYHFGVYHSNTGHHRTKFYLGLSLNKSFPVVMERLYGDKQTSALQLLQGLGDTLADAERTYPRLVDKLESMQRREVKESDLNEILLIAARRHVLPWSRIGQVDVRARKENNLTRWRLLNVFADVVKIEPPVRQLEEAYQFSQIVAPPIVRRREQQEV